MSKRDKNFEYIKDTYDEIIKESIKMEMEDEVKPLTDKDLEEMGIPLPPPDLYDRIMSERQKRESTAHTRWSRKKIRRLILIAAIIFVLIFGAMSAQAVRVYVFKMTNHVTENSIKFSGVNEGDYSYDTKEVDAYKKAEEDLGVPILKPTYLPEGYVFDSIRVYENDHIVFIYKNQEDRLKISQTLLYEDLHTGEIVDEKEGHTYTIKAQNTEITIGESEQSEIGVKWLNAVWHDEKLMYRVDGSCSKEEFENIIKNLK